MSIPISQFICPPYPLGNHKLVVYICDSISPSLFKVTLMRYNLHSINYILFFFFGRTA